MGDISLLILYAADDETFVRGYLMPALDEGDSSLLALGPAELAHRPIATLGRELESARAVLVVLSPSFLADPWICRAEELASTAAIAGRATVIGVQLHECELPLHLEARVPLDFRDPARWDEELAQLAVFLARPLTPPASEARPPPAAEASSLGAARKLALASIQRRRSARRWGSFAAIAVLVLTLTARCTDHDRVLAPSSSDIGYAPPHVNHLLDAHEIDRELRTWDPDRDHTGALVGSEACLPAIAQGWAGARSLSCRIRADQRPPWDRVLDGVVVPRSALR